MLCTLGWGCVGSARKTAKPTVLGRDTHHSRAQCRTGLSMEAAAGAAAQAPAPQCVVCGAPTTTDDAAQHTCGGDKGRESGVSNHLGAVRCTLSRLSETSGRRDTLMRAHASLPATDFSTVAGALQEDVTDGTDTLWAEIWGADIWGADTVRY